MTNSIRVIQNAALTPKENQLISYPLPDPTTTRCCCRYISPTALKCALSLCLLKNRPCTTSFDGPRSRAARRLDSTGHHPLQTCTLDCLLLRCGRTTLQTCLRQRFVEPEAILTELREALATIPHLDFISFSGSGEPTLNSELGFLIGEIKKITPYRVAVLTNGTLLHLPEVRRDLLAADVVLPSLDAATPSGFQQINQPCEELGIDRIIDGLVSFRREYRGELWLEIFFLMGINTSDSEIDALHAAVKRIGPDRVQLNTLDRPPAYPESKPHPSLSWRESGQRGMICR